MFLTNYGLLLVNQIIIECIGIWLKSLGEEKGVMIDEIWPFSSNSRDKLWLEMNLY